MDDLQKYIHLSKYSRYIPEINRRELSWEQTVHRYYLFFIDRIKESLKDEFKLACDAIVKFNVMPSMRALMTAGPALERDHAAGYNCAGRAIIKPRVFDELFYLLMCGCGVGFSVESRHISKLPEVPETLSETDTTIIVRDSKIGWASALRELISLLYGGKIPKWDLSRVRPAGARLKVFGGRASGPDPLDLLFKNVVRIFTGSTGRKLSSVECHDIMCHIASTVIVGSVRRSACISFSDLNDDLMRRAKTGEWWTTDGQRALANNSVMYKQKPDIESFTKEFRSLYRSKAGERGIVNEEAVMRQVVSSGRNKDTFYILNPCAEAILNGETGGLCNLSEVVIRPNDDLQTLKEKVVYATILGTIQSTLTNFRYLSSGWAKTAEEERLLGVSLTGIMDHPILGYPGDKTTGWLKELKQVCKDTNKRWARELGINESKQLTLIKPSGTVSQLVDCASGIHPRYSQYYIRTVTQDIKDPLTDLMIAEGVPYKTVGEKVYFQFPKKSPASARTAQDVGSLEQLDLWKIYKECWCDGNPSQTIYYTEDSYLDVQAWVWKNWDKVCGLSFFPKDDHIYEISPFKSISKEEYEKAVSEFPKEINWKRLPEFEKEDSTTGTQEFACVGGACEI